ncbi:hypothetical protein KC323_g8024 [Hortaea werneckii]|nr:hypothetical protein KC323_g8024 [Hortaea werneckii]
MGNSSSKDERRPSRPEGLRQVNSRTEPGQPSPAEASQNAPTDRLAAAVYGSRNGSRRGSRADLSFLSLGRDRDREATVPERPRETKQEREARRAERDRQARVKERERSMREEGVDGGFLVTLGTYTGPEDFNKAIVRQLQIERRLAPFWKGLNDHSESWTEAQLVAAVRGLPIPAADEIPPELAQTASRSPSTAQGADANVNSLTVPITGRSQSYQSDNSANLSASHPAFSNSNSGQQSGAALFRGRAKTLASLATGNKSPSPDMSPKEIQLSKDPYINGLPIEAYLYKEASECPICFLYYPPYLNQTRCCDQPICSECFVQIRRPDPHPPEHEQPGEQRPPEDEAEQLVSEVAACPFCVTPEFGVTYEAPPFRRGLGYANQQHPLKDLNSAMSSSSSLQSGAGRRRAQSLSATSPQVITTDKVRPDWAKKLADARAHAMRRSAAATALHNAAYMMNDGQSRGGLSAFSRRRRTLFSDSPGASGSGTPQQQEDGGNDMLPARSSSRRNRVDDLEDLMMMEAIRLSLAAEEDRKRKDEKEARKEGKKRVKEEKKQAKRDEKQAKKNGSGSLYRAGTNESGASTVGGSAMARSTSNLGAPTPIPEEQVEGKGKAPAQDFAGFNPLSDKTSTLNRDTGNEQRDVASSSQSPSEGASQPRDDPQGHLEVSRANIQPTTTNAIPVPSQSATHQRHLSNASSVASSVGDSTPGSVRPDSHDVSSRDETPPSGTTPAHSEPMFNFQSLAAMIGNEDEKPHASEQIEEAEPSSRAEEELKEPSPTASPRVAPASLTEGNRSRGDSGESSSSAPPPIYVEHPPTPGADEEITPAPRAEMVHDPDKKEYGAVNVLEHGGVRESTH